MTGRPSVDSRAQDPRADRRHDQRNNTAAPAHLEGSKSRQEEETDAESRDVLSFLDGDQPAFERLVGRYESRIRRLAFGFVRDHQLAEDIAQDTFLQAFRRVQTLKNPGSFRSWLFSIALNRSRDELRRRARFQEVPDLEAPLRSFREPASTESLLESREAGRFLARLIAELPEKQRVPLVLKEAGGMTYAAIASQLGVPMGTVQIRIHRARLRLRDRLVELGVTDWTERGRSAARGDVE